jgi:hypothetical protein
MDVSNVYGLTKRQIKRAHRLGFTADEYVVYDLEHNNPHEYLSEYERMMKFRSRIRDYRIVFDNKILFYCIIRNFAPVNTIYAYIKKGNFIALEPEITREGLFSLLRIQEKLVVKLFSAGGGEGFRLLEYNAGKYYVNRQECSQADMFQLLEKLDDCLIEKYCRQSDFENALSPYSVNTIRMVTMCNYLGGEELTFAIHRFGATKDSCVDNAHQGGFCAPIDIKSGRLGDATTRNIHFMFDGDHRIKHYSVHPATGVEIQGQVIPNWESLCKEVVSLHRKLAFTGARFIAWDIALTDNGFCVIEANASSSFDILQQGTGGQRNGKLGDFLKRNKLID